jgi:cell division protein FtsL
MNGYAKALVAAITVVLFVSAVGVIWSKHQSRATFIELQRLQAERDRLDVEWWQLKIQQSYSATPGRVEQVAFGDLKMITPRPSDVRIVPAPESAR